MFFLKKTPLNEVHRALGAKMVDFGGWDMPVQYEGIVAEHLAVRSDCGLFDVSHMGEVIVEGDKAFEFVQNLITNDVSKLVDGQCLYSPMLYDDAGVVDDLLVYKFNDKRFMIVVNASNVEKDFAWMKEQSLGASLRNESDSTAELALQGPKAQSVLQKLTETNLSEIKFFHFREISVAGVSCIVSRTGYTGEDGFEIYFPSSEAVKMWNFIFESGREFGLKPIGLGARDTLRLEAGLMLYGNDIDARVTPFEAPLKWTVKLEKGNFIGKKALEEKEASRKRKLVGFELVERGVPRHGSEVFVGGARFDVVSSGTFSPTLKKPIGFCFVPKDLPLGAEVEIEIHGKLVKARTCSHRFYKIERK